MSILEVTIGASSAHVSRLEALRAYNLRRAGGLRSMTWVMVMAASTILAGCVTINAPEDAIVIELNINITQEVIYRLAADAGNTIDDNADIF